MGVEFANGTSTGALASAVTRNAALRAHRDDSNDGHLGTAMSKQQREAEPAREPLAEPPPLRWLCFEASAVDDVDYSAAETIRSVYATLKEKGIRLVVADVMEDLNATSRYRMKDLFGDDAFFDHLEDVMKQYRQQFKIAEPPRL